MCKNTRGASQKINRNIYLMTSVSREAGLFDISWPYPAETDIEDLSSGSMVVQWPAVIYPKSIVVSRSVDYHLR